MAPSIALRLRPTSLLAKARTNPDAFAAFYAAYSEQVLVYLTRRLLDAEVALDLASETFAIALERRGQFRGRTAEEEQAWLYAIARSQLSLFWRRGRFEREALLRVGVDVPGLTDAELERIEDVAGVAGIAKGLGAAMAALPDDQRRAVELRVVHDCGYDDLARLLHVSQQTARARVSRGLRRLGDAMRSSGVMVEDVL